MTPDGFAEVEYVDREVVCGGRDGSGSNKPRGQWPIWIILLSPANTFTHRLARVRAP